MCLLWLLSFNQNWKGLNFLVSPLSVIHSGTTHLLYFRWLFSPLWDTDSNCSSSSASAFVIYSLLLTAFSNTDTSLWLAFTFSIEWYRSFSLLCDRPRLSNFRGAGNSCKFKKYARSKVLMSVSKEFHLGCDVMPCTAVHYYHCIRGNCCLYLHGMAVRVKCENFSQNFNRFIW